MRKYRSVIYNQHRFSISLPREFCDRLGIQKGNYVAIELVNNKIVITPAEPSKVQAGVSQHANPIEEVAPA